MDVQKQRHYINERTRNLKQGAIRLMFDRAARLDHVINMGIGEPDLVTSEPICLAAKKALDDGVTHYTPNAGNPEMRRAVAEHSPLRGLRYDPMKEVIITNGGMGGLSLLMAAILDPGDEVLIQDPQWLNYVAQVSYYGGVPVRVPTKAGENFEMQPDVVESLITDRTKALIINSPNNPTGYVVRPETLEKLAEVARRHHLLVISDEVYNTLLYDGAGAKSIAELPGMKEQTVVVNSLSKAYAMTGWRIGYVAGPEEIVDRMTKCQENFNSCANAPGQTAAIYALEHPELSEEIRTVFDHRRDIMLEGLSNIPGMSFRRPNGAFYVFPSIEAFGISDTEFCNQLLEKQRVACIPGSAFGECGAGHVRMAYTTGDSQLKEALDRIRIFCAGL